MRNKFSGRLSWGILAAAVCMCLYGAAASQAEDVFIKAIRICMECIGLG